MRIVRAIQLLLVVGCASCAPAVTRGMTASPEGGNATAAPSPKSLVVAFPATACTGSESAVFFDEKGRFLGTVAPGTASSVAVADDTKRVFEVASSDVTARPGTWFARNEIPLTSDDGVLVEVPTADSHNCEGKWSGPLLPRPVMVRADAAAKAAAGLKWLKPDGNGDLWLTENRARVNELIGRPNAEPRPAVVTVVAHGM